MNTLKPKQQWRVIFNDDATNNFGGHTTAQTIRDRIDYLHEAGVDVLTWCTCSPDLCNYPTGVGEWVGDPDRPVQLISGHAWNYAENHRRLQREGNDPIEVMTQRCHKHGMPILGSARMNDIHHIHGYRHTSNVNRFVLDHPDWCIRNGEGRIVGGMDYAVAHVRERRLAILREQIDRYDLDGLELDFMRVAPFFQPGLEQAGTAVMTAFVRDVRRMLYDVASSKGRDRLILGARVETTLEQCRSVGTDVPTWLAEGWLDYLCPSHQGKPDLNIPVDDFVAAAAGRCGVFPTMQCNGAAQYDRETVFTIEKYRGMGHNYFSFGAQGISTFNFMMGKIGTWHVKRHHGGWHMMRLMHESADLARHERRYFYDHEVAPNRWLRLDRLKDVGRRIAVPLRIAEDFADTSWQRTLRFKPNDLSVGDRIEFDINGVPITDRLRSDFVFDMADPPNSGRFCCDLAGTAARYGDNQLGATLLEANPALQPWTAEYLGYAEELAVMPIHFTEIEVVVRKANIE